MKRKKVDILFVDETNRKHKIYAYLSLIVIVSLIVLSCSLIYFLKNKKEYVNYNENSLVDYKVYLKENDFFEEKYLGKDREYIASLIDYINANLNYTILFDSKEVDIDYSKRIDAEVEVYDINGKKPLYKMTEELLNSDVKHLEKQKSLNIAESVKINYEHYNEIVSSFLKTYDLRNANSFLTVKMYINVSGDCTNLSSNSYSEAVVSLKIPLTTKTMNIEIESNLVESDKSLLVCKENTIKWFVPFIGIILFIVDVALIIKMSLYIIKSRSARDIYKRELKHILNNYHSFIQKINNNFDLKGYQILKVDTFTDMLEIRDTVGQPILMVENKTKTGVHFIIPTNTKLLYTFTLKESNMKKESNKDAIELI